MCVYGGGEGKIETDRDSTENFEDDCVEASYWKTQKVLPAQGMRLSQWTRLAYLS